MKYIKVIGLAAMAMALMALVGTGTAAATTLDTGNGTMLAAVIVDEPQGEIYGGSVAAPAFGQIAEFALPYLGVPQE